MEKPVIILGGGILGSLLAIRLKEIKPEISFRLYETSPEPPKHLSPMFRKIDLRESLNWLLPYVTHSWGTLQMIDTCQFHQMTRAILRDSVLLGSAIPLEALVESSAFVIDTRNSCQVRRLIFKKNLALEVELSGHHDPCPPLTFDKTVAQEGLGRFISSFPLGDRRLLLRDTTFSDLREQNISELRSELLKTAREKKWKIETVLKEEYSVEELPLSKPIILSQNRVISLAALNHDTTGCSLSLAVPLIDRMVKTSFRFGEVREVVQRFRSEKEPDREYFRSLNRQIAQGNFESVYRSIFFQPEEVCARFARGELTLLDRYRIFLMQKRLRLSVASQRFFPVQFRSPSSPLRSRTV